MKLVSGIVDSGFFAQSALSAEVATKDSLGRNISETYLTAVDIPESATWNATTQTVSANSAQWAGGTANPQIPVTSTSGISIFESGDKVYFNISADYAFTADLTGKQDSLTFGYKDTAISSIDNSALYDNSAHARITTLAGRISDLSSNKLDTTAFSDVSGSFLTAHQDLSDYQTIAGMTAYQPAGDYLTTADSANFYTTANESGFITGVDLTPYQTVEGMTAYQPAGSYLTTADSANFYTTANESGYLTAVPDTYLQNTDLTITDGKVTEISGVPLSAGDELPSGVMNTSALEYNAVNEISGYNGSAIAQYGAEKQWLQHDDTLVHAANSAQYALGVNLSAVAQLLGVDETVLYSGDGTLTTAFTVSEPLSGFERIRIYVHAASDGQIFEHIEEQAPPTGSYISYTHNYTIPNAYVCQCFLGYLANGLTFSNTVTRRNFWAPTGTGTYVVTSTDNQNRSANGWIYKVVGIGRKQ